MHADYPRMPQGTCYQSSMLMSWLHPELTYVEGVLRVTTPYGSFALAHAWNVTADNTVVDTTLSEKLQDAELVYTEVRRDTDLTIPELDARGNPADLVELAATMNPTS